MTSHCTPCGGRAARSSVTRCSWSLGLLVLIAALTLPLGGAAGALPTRVEAQAKTPSQPADQGSETYDELAGCVSDTGRLLVVLLVDESGSLQQTDPQAVRVAAAKTALAGLARLTDSAGTAAKVDVQVAAFSNQFKPVGEWRSLDPSTLPSIQTTVDGLAARDTGMDTDFINALTGAREALSEQAVSVGSDSTSSCKAILLFTDGRYDLGVRTTQAQEDKYGDSKPYAAGLLLNDEKSVVKAEKLGVEALCRAGGVADQVRADHIVTLTVALTAKLRAADQNFLQAVTSGKGGSEKCGKRDGSRSGVFLPASDLESLIGAFDAVVTRVAGGSPLGPPLTLPVCARKACDKGSTEFQVDQSVRRIHLFVKVPSASTQVELRAPGVDTPLVLSTRASTEPPFGGGKVQVAWPSSKAATIDVVPAAAAAGAWSVALVQPNGAVGDGTVQVYLFTDLLARLAGIKEIEVGSPTKLVADVVSQKDGKVVKTLRSADIFAAISDPVSGSSVRVDLPLSGSHYSGTYRPPPSLTTSVVRVVLHLEAITRDGVSLSSVSPQVSIPTRRPAGYPLVVPAELTFPPVSGKGSTNSELLVLSGVKGAKPGCMWVEKADIAASPDEVPSIALDVEGAGRSAKQCTAAPASGSLPVTLKFDPGGRASGSVRGSVRVWTQKSGDKALPTDIPFSFEMTRGLDKTKRLVVFAGLLLLGLGLPIALLFVMNFLSARFQALEFVQGANLPVMIRRNQQIVRVADDGQESELHLYGYDFDPLPESESVRNFTWAGMDFAAKASLNPFSGGYATASPEGGTANVAREGRKVNLALSLAGSWMFLYDPDETDAATRRILGSLTNEREPPEIHGRLVTFIARGAVPPQVDRLLLDIFERLPRTAKRLSELVREARNS